MEKLPHPSGAMRSSWSVRVVIFLFSKQSQSIFGTLFAVSTSNHGVCFCGFRSFSFSSEITWNLNQRREAIHHIFSLRPCCTPIFLWYIFFVQEHFKNLPKSGQLAARNRFAWISSQEKIGFISSPFNYSLSWSATGEWNAGHNFHWLKYEYLIN